MSASPRIDGGIARAPGASEAAIGDGHSGAASDPVREAPSAAGPQRLDKWLWFARLAKTRTQAAALVTAGRVRVNRERINRPSHSVKRGDVVTATVGRDIRVLKVRAFIERRGPVSEAQATYEELTAAAVPTKRLVSGSGRQIGGADGATAVVTHAARAPGAGRPTKRDRRAIDKLDETSR